MRLELHILQDQSGDTNDPPFQHIVRSASSCPPVRVKAPSSVFDLAKRPVRVHLEQDHGQKMWVRDGGMVTGWGEVRRQQWEASEKLRKSVTTPPKTPDAARAKGKRVREIDGDQS